MRCAAPRRCALGCGSAPLRCAAVLSSSRWSPPCGSSHCGATSTRGFGSAVSVVSTQSYSPRVGSTGSGWPGRSAIASIRPSFCPRRDRERLPFRFGRARSIWWPPQTMPRRGAGSRRSGCAWPRSAAAAWPRSPRTTTARCSRGSSPTRTAGGWNDAGAAIRRPSGASWPRLPLRAAEALRVIVTRPEGQGEELAARLRELGHEPVLCPLVRVELLGGEPIDIEPYDWLLVGSATAAALEERGMRVDLVPAVSTQEGLLAELPRPAGRVLFAGAEDARRLLVEELKADFVPLYRTIELEPGRVPAGDLVVLASPSAARAFARLGLELPAVSIGPQTTSAAASAGVVVAAEAETHDLDGLLDAVARLAP